MRNEEVIKAFINGEEKGSGSNLFINGNKLINYSTCIAYRKDNGMILLNGEHYSRTTSKYQNMFRRTFIKEVNYIEFKTEEDFNNAINGFKEKEIIEEKYIKSLISNKTFTIKDSKDCAKKIIEEYKRLNKKLDYDESLDYFINNIEIVGLSLKDTVNIYGTIYAEINDEEVLRFIRDPEDGKYCDEEYLRIFL